LKLKTHSSP